MRVRVRVRVCVEEEEEYAYKWDDKTDNALECDDAEWWNRWMDG